MIWFNATTYAIDAPVVSELTEEVKIYLVDSRSFQLIRKTYNVENGNVNSFLKIPGSIEDGIYYLKGETSKSDQQNYYWSKIVIKKNIIPQFIIKATFPKRDIVPGNQFEMLLEFQDYYSEPKRNVDYQIEFYDGDYKIAENVGKVKKDGLANVNVKVPSKLQSGKFSYRISAESKGEQATLSGRLPVLTEKIYIDFIPENGKIIHGIDANISVFSYDVHGVPMSIAGDLFEDDKLLLSFTCDNNGLGSFVMTPEVDKSYQVQVRGPVYVEKKYDLPPIETKGIALKVISKKSSKASYKMINGYKSVRSVYLIGVSEGVIFWTSEHEIDR